MRYYWRLMPLPPFSPLRRRQFATPVIFADALPFRMMPLPLLRHAAATLPLIIFFLFAAFRCLFLSR